MEKFSQKEIESAANDHQVDGIGFRDEDIRRSIDIDKINKAAQWISTNMVKVSAINRRNSSYGLKHVCEKDIGYVSNGEFIIAAILLGYKYKRCASNSQNCWVNMGTGAINAARKRQASEGKR